jgi:hypothetical protein
MDIHPLRPAPSLLDHHLEKVLEPASVTRDVNKHGLVGNSNSYIDCIIELLLIDDSRKH